jgi:hypothetical protein
MLEANGAYLTEHSRAMTRRQLLAAAILLRYREPAGAPAIPANLHALSHPWPRD